MAPLPHLQSVRHSRLRPERPFHPVRMTLDFTVIGTPAPQGSKTKTRWGIREDNPNTKPWRAEVKAAAVEAHAGRPALDGPLKLELILTHIRPASHYGTGRNAGVLKESAPTWKETMPDWDKLGRAISDSLTQAGAIRDDGRIAYAIVKKVWGDVASARIIVTQL